MAASILIERFRRGGIIAPRIAIAEAKRAGLRLALACALLEKESGGGKNVYGHDPSIFRGAGEVTRSNYAKYKRLRIASGNRSMQGVGPCQLTWWEFQDQADAQGGCWRPAINMRVGFLHLASLIKRYGESDGARRYNGSGAAAEAYSRDLLEKARKWEAIIDGAEAPSVGLASLRRGDRGKRVVRLTTRLSRVNSPVTGERYLDGPSKRLNEDVDDAVRAFQRDHGLDVDGVAGPRTMRKLKAAVANERERPRPAPKAQPANGDGRPPKRRGHDRAPSKKRVTVTALAHDVERLEDDLADAWRKLVATGHRRRRRLLAERAAMDARNDGLSAHELAQLLKALARIEGKLGTLVEISEHKPEMPVVEAPAVVAETPVEETLVAETAVAPVGGDMRPPETVAAVAVDVATEAPATTAAAPAAAPPKALKKYSVPELVREAEAFDQRARSARAELIRRYEAADHELRRLVGHDGPRRSAPLRRDDERERRTGSRRGGPTDNDDVSERRRRRRAAGADRPSRAERDPLGGNVVNTTLGDRGVFVRRSKIALSRYLAKKGNHEHVALRRTLRREAATPKTGGVASPAWAKAVRAAQHIAGRPVTGEMDGELTQLLLPYWPRDQAVKRIVRTTPGWRAIPGQLTPNFNVKEFACKDAARTPYIKGLMREQGLSKKDARARAKGLAERLERVRKRSGDRPLVVTSAFRTKAYNASLPGSATNSAHTRGYAVDVPPPRGISLDQHKQHMMQGFECGIGYYPMGRGYFIHGDYDKTLGGRRLW